jgi:hypothetical protein
VLLLSLGGREYLGGGIVKRRKAAKSGRGLPQAKTAESAGCSKARQRCGVWLRAEGSALRVSVVGRLRYALGLLAPAFSTFLVLLGGCVLKYKILNLHCCSILRATLLGQSDNVNH